MTPCVEKKKTSGRMLGVGGSSPHVGAFAGGLGQHPKIFFLDLILGEQTYLWFCVLFFHMVLGVMIFYPWYLVDLINGTMVLSNPGLMDWGLWMF